MMHAIIATCLELMCSTIVISQTDISIRLVEPVSFFLFFLSFICLMLFCPYTPTAYLSFFSYVCPCLILFNI
ncbi:hypothetical protein BDW42DRAFT_43317 [Aspergillus taichungensis]|uniref:Uncharacterized protein n=1 Tax=Aspergillus taichungensis TaxID=482145 RepID=A0A2J5HE81_9EURO|nr:hypothetical protein BDW42DRAFT_43317 [Aspergillus taichungensis]